MTKPLLAFGIVAVWMLAPAPARIETTLHAAARVVAAAVGAPESAQRERSRERDLQEEIERINRTVTLGDQGELDLSNISGDIVVTGGGGRDVRIDAIKRARGRTGDDARRQLELVEVSIAPREGRLEIRTRYPRGERNLRVSVDFDVAVPAGTRIFVKSISGDVTVRSVTGAAYVETISGNLDLTSVTRLAQARSVSGDVRLTSASAEGELNAQSVSGDLRARDLKARYLELSTVSGDVILTDASCDRAAIKTVSGSLRYTGSIARNGRYELKSHSGDVQLALPGEVGFELEASSFSGTVRSDLPVVLRGRDAPDTRRARRTIVGVYGDGSASIEATTFSGNIVITKR